MHGIAKLAAVSAVALSLSGCKSAPPPENYYDVPPATAYERLRQADVIGFRDARQCGMLIHLNAIEDAPRTITWTVSSSNIRLLYFTVRVAPQGQGSLITIDVPKAANGGEFYDAEQDYKHPAVMQPLRPAVRELIDSAIASRPYDWHRIPDPLSTGALCDGMGTNFQASGKPYDLNDPSGMTHEAAEEARQKTGQNFAPDPDPLPPPLAANP
jgi:hypothetical protein